MEYIVVGFMCLVIGYGIGIAHHVRQLEAEIKLRHEWEVMANGLVQPNSAMDSICRYGMKYDECSPRLEAANRICKSCEGCGKQHQ